MRRKKTADPQGYGRLLDAWIPPAHAGEALGCFASTFTFHASFFETECLGRMLQLECDPDTAGAAYLIEREEKMARLMSACVVVDRAHARGQRSLRWDLVPFRTKVGILHAKLSILLWQNHARVIVASANLTENGYRQNLEVFTSWDFYRDGKLPAELFGAAADFASDVLSQCREMNPGESPAVERSRKFLASARQRVAAWLPADSATSRLQTALIPLTPKSGSVLDQVRAHWPSGRPPNTLYVLSPFFDQGPVNSPTKAAWDILRQRGGAEVIFSVVAEPIRNSERLLVHAPKALQTALPVDGRQASLSFERLKMPEGRPLHAKSLLLQGDDHMLHCIGSSNFTSAGLGLTQQRNWELNVAAWTALENRDEVRARRASWPEREPGKLDPDSVSWAPASSTEDELDPLVPLLPDWCGSAIFFLRKTGQGVLKITLGANPPMQWSIHDPNGTHLILEVGGWRTKGSPHTIEAEWNDSRPPTELVVRADGLNGDVQWPVEVRSFSDLPPPLELRNLTLEQLLEILTSALPLHRCLQRMWRQTGDEPAPSAPELALDPLRRYARDTHLLERTRRFSLAMTGMRRRLESPIPSEEYLQWRLHGPIGVAKVAEAILKEAGSDGEKAFLLGELALELSQITPRNDPGCLARKRIQEAIQTLVLAFENQAGPLLQASDGSLRSYVRAALKKARE